MDRARRQKASLGIRAQSSLHLEYPALQIPLRKGGRREWPPQPWWGGYAAGQWLAYVLSRMGWAGCMTVKCWCWPDQDLGAKGDLGMDRARQASASGYIISTKRRLRAHPSLTISCLIAYTCEDGAKSPAHTSDCLQYLGPRSLSLFLLALKAKPLNPCCVRV